MNIIQHCISITKCVLFQEKFEQDQKRIRMQYEEEKRKKLKLQQVSHIETNWSLPIHTKRQESHNEAA